MSTHESEPVVTRVRRTLAHLTPSETVATSSPTSPAQIGVTEDDAAVAMAIGGSATSEESDPYEIERTFVDLNGLPGVPLVGTDSDLAEDYVAGLNLMSQKCDPKTKLGYVDTVESGHVLLCTKPEFVSRVLTTSVQHFLGGLRPPSAAFFGPKVLFILEGKEWHGLRNVLKKAFQKHNVKLMSEDIAKAAMGFQKILDQTAESGKDIDFMRAVAAFHLQAIGYVAFNYDLGCISTFLKSHGEQEHVINQSFEYLLEELPRRAYAADFATQNDFESDTLDNRQMAQMSWQVRDVIRGVIRERLDATAKGEEPRGDLLQMMLDTYVEDYPEAKGNLDLLTAELGDNLVEIMFAGYNTAVPTTCHAFFFLAHHPQYAKRVKEEIDTVLQGRLPTVDDLPKLKFIEKVFMEALRLCPPASLVSRQTTRDLKLGDLDIKRGTRVWLPACYIHRDPTSWEDPLKFNPDRFDSKLKRGSYIPFSDGPRNCAGRNFAMFEGISAIVALYQRYDVVLAPDMDWKTIFTGFGLRPFDFNTARVCMRLNVIPRADK